MKTIKQIIISVLAIAMSLPVVAQEQYLHIYKGGSREKSYVLSSIDSMLIDETANGSFMDLYNKGNKHRVGNLAEISEFKVGGAVLPSGIYMGVLGFNSQLYSKEIGSLSSSTKSAYTSFVNNLTSSNGTLLYYGVENALDALKNAEVPEDLINVTLVTFTDGLDQGSFMMQSKYYDTNSYLTALNNRIKSEKVQNIPINAYSIGLRGNDVSDLAQFQKNLQYLASKNNNAVEVSNISEVNAKFQEIANQVYNESLISTVGLTIPGQSNGTKIRFTFDNVSNAANSTMYIEGTFRLSDRALTDVTYHGLSCSSGATVIGQQDGIFVTFKFEGVKSLTSLSISSSYIDQWTYVSSSNKWQINSEFTPENNTTMEVSRKSALIMLVLDCSSSLGSQFSTAKSNANSFISTLAGYGNDEKFSAIDIMTYDDIDIFTTLEKDEMVFVKGGSFLMGAQRADASAPNYDSEAWDDESPVHSVTLSDYYIGKYEVTQQLWEYVMKYSGLAADGSTMSAYAADVWLGDNPSSSYGVGNYYPAYNVSWVDIVNIFIPRLNKITGKTFRLPTEAEWEYAARGGNKSQGYKYSGSNTIDYVAWYSVNSSDKTHEVGTKAPNELGLYDMSGNVWEWCSDWYDEYSSSTQTNPAGPTSGSYRVLRGGSWDGGAGDGRVANRHYSLPDSRYDHHGFRLVCLTEDSGGSTETPDEPNESVDDIDIFTTLEKDEMVFVEGGTFLMGMQSTDASSPNYDYGADNDESPVHSVTLSDYYIGKYEVTQQLWEYVMKYSGLAADGSTMSAYAADVWLGDNPSSSYGVGNYYPAYNVSWVDIVNIFIPRLNKITGKTFRLPTEAEWEYAARGGNKSQGYKYSGSNTIDYVAWYSVNSSDKTHEVGTKAPNELGLYDMSGNVWEWCSDWYNSSYYTSSATSNPTGPASGFYRVLRGGCWSYYAGSSRVTNRDNSYLVTRYSSIGFRLVCLK